jgi:hypothetical protein
VNLIYALLRHSNSRYYLQEGVQYVRLGLCIIILPFLLLSAVALIGPVWTSMYGSVAELVRNFGRGAEARSRSSDILFRDTMLSATLRAGRRANLQAPQRCRPRAYYATSASAIDAPDQPSVAPSSAKRRRRVVLSGIQPTGVPHVRDYD